MKTSYWKSLQLIGIQIRFFIRQISVNQRLPAVGRFYSSIYFNLIIGHYFFSRTYFIQLLQINSFLRTLLLAATNNINM